MTDINSQLTRAEAIQRVGLAAVEGVEKEQCEPTSRCRPDLVTDIEFMADYQLDDSTSPEYIQAYYYQPELDLDDDGNQIDPDDQDWVIDHYRLTDYHG